MLLALICIYGSVYMVFARKSWQFQNQLPNVFGYLCSEMNINNQQKTNLCHTILALWYRFVFRGTVNDALVSIIYGYIGFSFSIWFKAFLQNWYIFILILIKLNFWVWTSFFHQHILFRFIILLFPLLYWAAPSKKLKTNKSANIMHINKQTHTHTVQSQYNADETQTLKRRIYRSNTRSTAELDYGAEQCVVHWTLGTVAQFKSRICLPISCECCE